MAEQQTGKLHTTFRCDSSIHFKLKEISKRENRSLSNVIETLLLKGLESDILTTNNQNQKR